jgi:7,8-dihydro-6-hydroxymethylpterin dimethyltransferase
MLANTRERMGEHYTANQVLGRTQTIGCVAVEITQRCNLDCTLCYLSEHSQSVKDIPIEEVFKRLDDVLEHYGEGTHVQITGGDPTLRKHTELVEIVRYAADIGLYPALFTNGIAATRTLLTSLAAVGLQDVAFHVDTTQRREGYQTEIDLNAIRKEYIARAHGLGLMVVFNTTVHDGNFYHIPSLVRFFIEQSADIGLVSFQLQAETGRGEWRSRDALITQQSMKKQIEAGAARTLPWGVVDFGHSDCHSYMPTSVVNNRVFPVIAERNLFGRFLSAFEHIRTDRHAKPYQVVMDYGLAILMRPRTWWPALSYGIGQLRQMGRHLVLGRGKVHKLSFFMQNFMDANELVQERVDACSFMVMTGKGPVSMCEHNAKRDDFILKPLMVEKQDGTTEHYVPVPEIPKYKQASGAN